MIIFLTFSLFVWLYIRFSRRYEKSVAFFHPYCDAGGGGEKVLWEAVNAVRQTFPNYQIFVYTGDDASSSDILFRAESRFNLKISDVKLVKLKWRWLVEVRVSHLVSQLVVKCALQIRDLSLFDSELRTWQTISNVP